MKNRPFNFIFLFIFVTMWLKQVLSPDFIRAMPWSRDMFDQPSVKAQEDFPPETPEGIVPNKGKEKDVKKRDESGVLKNPIPLSSESVERGKAVYKVYCNICHGETGIGDGVVGKKFVHPADLTSRYIQTKPDGDIYYTITHGGLAVMPHYGDAILPEDRWNLINYIKAVLGKGQ